VSTSSFKAGRDLARRRDPRKKAGLMDRDFIQTIRIPRYLQAVSENPDQITIKF
ncbi:hypothetical protein TorRG33x02_262520, partial [Trema orientale]